MYTNHNKLIFEFLKFSEKCINDSYDDDIMQKKINERLYSTTIYRTEFLYLGQEE